jgi:hypothetical protein
MAVSAQDDHNLRGKTRCLPPPEDEELSMEYTKGSAWAQTPKKEKRKCFLPHFQ